MILKPDFHYRTINDISIDKIKLANIKYLLIDIDNTLVSWDTKLPTAEVIVFLNNLQKNDLKVCLLSNNNKERVESFAKILSIPYIYKAKKPLKFNFRNAIKLIDGKKEETAIIGDQVFTDILGSKNIGIRSILVDPIGQKEFLWTMFVRKIENLFRNRYNYTE